jgi:type VI secretion system FHA domain protein
VNLTLEIIASQSAQMGTENRKVFGSAGGVIGRVGGMPGDRRDAWILPHTKVSKEHARITYVDGTFYIEDASRNGVGLNSSKNRLAKGQPYPLKSGDRIFIDPYEIAVSVASESYQPYQETRRPLDLPSFPRDEVGLEDEVDPLNLLDPQPVRPPRRKVPTADELNSASPWAGHYSPPHVVPPPAQTPPPRPSSMLMPEGYNPLAPEEAAPEPDELDAFFAPLAPPAPTTPSPPTPPPVVRIDRQQPSPFLSAPTDVAPPETAPPSVAPDAPAPVVREQQAGADLAAVLAGAGLEGVTVTPELARSFGEILNVVVSGVMDVLKARHQIKDEFRMRMTHLRVADNNPLKFSVDVNDALHNLLVKRNQAYLSPVQAFEDAFQDLRHHQIAMLAGMRVAFEFMLREFAPDRLEEQFDRRIEKGGLMGKGVGLKQLRSWRYWDLYRDKQLEIAKDPEASFRKLFGEAFAKAYEEQLERLRTQR